MNKEMDDINITDEFYFFLNFLVEEKSWTGRDIADVVRYYWKYEKQWKEYLEYSEKEADRLWEELENDKNKRR